MFAAVGDWRLGDGLAMLWLWMVGGELEVSVDKVRGKENRAGSLLWGVCISSPEPSRRGFRLQTGRRSGWFWGIGIR